MNNRRLFKYIYTFLAIKKVTILIPCKILWTTPVSWMYSPQNTSLVQTKLTLKNLSSFKCFGSDIAVPRTLHGLGTSLQEFQCIQIMMNSST